MNPDLVPMLLDVSVDPCDGSVHPSLQYVLMRGFAAMGWEQPQAASEDMAMEILKMIRPNLASGGTVAPSVQPLIGERPLCQPSRPDAGGGVRVKPLEWHDNRHAQSILGVYSIHSWSSGAFSILCPNKGYPDNNSFPTVDEAKAAAQADYERRILSALSTPPAAAESSASVEARLREALIILDERLRACGSLYTAEDAYDSLCREFVSEALSAVGDEAKESEGGCICQDQHRRGYCTEPGCPYAIRPSDPTAERREIVVRVLDRWKRSKNLHESLAAQSIEKELLAAIDGGASA